jgi:hypothetical protein
VLKRHGRHGRKAKTGTCRHRREAVSGEGRSQHVLTSLVPTGSTRCSNRRSPVARTDARVTMNCCRPLPAYRHLSDRRLRGGSRVWRRIPRRRCGICAARGGRRVHGAWAGRAAAGPGQYYVGFVEPSGGTADSMTLAIEHGQGEISVLEVVGDRYAGDGRAKASARTVSGTRSLTSPRVLSTGILCPVSTARRSSCWNCLGSCPSFAR